MKISGDHWEFPKVSEIDLFTWKYYDAGKIPHIEDCTNYYVKYMNDVVGEFWENVETVARPDQIWSEVNFTWSEWNGLDLFCVDGFKLQLYR